MDMLKAEDIPRAEAAAILSSSNSREGTAEDTRHSKCLMEVESADMGLPAMADITILTTVVAVAVAIHLLNNSHLIKVRF